MKRGVCGDCRHWKNMGTAPRTVRIWERGVWRDKEVRECANLNSKRCGLRLGADWFACPQFGAKGEAE